jgi:hypothetical protein
MSIKGYIKLKIMKIATIILISLVSISCNHNGISVVKTYMELHNSHDIEGAMLLYHDDIEFELVGTWIKSGKEEIRQLEEWDKALNSNLKFEAFEMQGDSVFCKVIEKNDWFKAVGIEQIIHDPTVFIVTRGHIMKIVAKPSQEIGKEIGAKLGSVYAWSKIAKDTTINELIKDGKFIYTEESAKKWLKLLDNWNVYNATTKTN